MYQKVSEPLNVPIDPGPHGVSLSRAAIDFRRRPTMLTPERVKEAYDNDMQRLGEKVSDPAVLPVSFNDITAQWLTGTLCRSHPDAEVVDWSMETVEQGTTNRVR